MLCLADYCDLYRCDIVAGIQTAEFWDISLCLEEDMEDIKQRCKVNINTILISQHTMVTCTCSQE